MGQKVHPRGFRLGVIESWDSRWFAGREYADLLHEDLRIRKFIKKRLYHAGISKVEIERAANKAEDEHLHGAPRHRDRQEGRRDREAQGGAGEADARRVLHQHPRDPSSGPRRAAGGREHRPAARAARGVSPRDEGGGRPRACAWARRASGCSAPAASAAPRSRAREWYREGRVPLHTCVPTSATASPRRRPPTA